ncbi:hypothetical protein KUTeg_011988 [Tegillarca granosa]|uniref:Cytochrome P450 n=1 Tax=Tegillarca granosa TaxID=220873 RepID=A0ABQ9F3H9_TEGGR|nr:hypothetical protein KUTeg_011988 [Tegillarca granosa]
MKRTEIFRVFGLITSIRPKNNQPSGNKNGHWMDIFASSHCCRCYFNDSDTEQCEDEWFDKYGDVIGYRFGSLLNISVKDPDILRQVLVKNFSNFSNRRLVNFTPSPVDKGIFFARDRTWKRIRTILSPTFSAGKLKQMNSEIERCSKLLVSNFEKHAEKEEVVSVKEFYGAFTMDVIASTAFGLQVDSQNNPDDSFIKHARAIFSRSSIMFRPALFLAVMFPFTTKFLKMARISFFPGFVIDFFVKEVTAMIEDRKRHPLVKKTGLFATYDKCRTRRTKRRFKLFKQRWNRQKTKSPNYENVAKLTYMEQVLFETLRMFPPLGRINRECAEEMIIGGVTFPKGAAIQVPIYQLHHDPRFFPEPELFNPDRWVPLKLVLGRGLTSTVNPIKLKLVKRERETHKENGMI